MNDEKEKIDTEIPIEVSEEERQIVLKALEEVERGEVILHEEMEEFFDTLLDGYKIPPSNQYVIMTKEKEVQKVDSLNKI